MYKFRKIADKVNASVVLKDGVEIGTIVKGSDIYGTCWIAQRADGSTAKRVTRREAAEALNAFTN